MPRVTVIIPTYNWSTVLPYSIGSVLRQSFTDFELLVVGDGCTDDSHQVVAAIADPRLRWINLPERHGHQSGPNNEGLRQARGSVIAYLGHDDMWLPHHLEVMVAAIDAGADVVHSIVHLIGAEGNILPPAWEDPLLPGLWMPPTGVAHRRIASEKVGGWRDFRDLTMDPETDLWIRMLQAGFKFQCVPQLTAVKFQAAFRKDSYKQRSSHEQRQWTDRILQEADLEAVELEKLRLASQRHILRRFNKTLFRALLAHTRAESFSWRMLFSLRRFLSLGKMKAPKKGADILRQQEFKGVQKPTGVRDTEVERFE